MGDSPLYQPPSSNVQLGVERRTLDGTPWTWDRIVKTINDPPPAWKKAGKTVDQALAALVAAERDESRAVDPARAALDSPDYDESRMVDQALAALVAAEAACLVANADYDAAKKKLPAAVVPVACTVNRTLREGIGVRFHNGLYPIDVDIGAPKDLDERRVWAESLIKELRSWPHTVAGGHSANWAAWAVLAGPVATSTADYKHCLDYLIAQLPEAVRDAVAKNQTGTSCLRFLCPGRPAYHLPDATHLAVPGRPAPGQPVAVAPHRSGRGGQSASERQAQMQAMLERLQVAPPPLTPEGMEMKRAEVRDALAAIPLEDGTGHSVWIKVGYALCAADFNWPSFGGRQLFVDWTQTNAYAGSTKPARADEQYSELERTRSTTMTIGPLWELARSHGWTGITDETTPAPEPEQQCDTERPPPDPHLTTRRRQVLLTQDEGKNVSACVQGVLESNNPPTLFSIPERRGVCAGDGTDAQVIAPLETHLSVTSRIQFLCIGRKGTTQAATPTTTLMKLVHIALRSELPVLNGVKHMPFFWDGSLIHQPGYHLPSGHLVDVPGDLEMGLSLAEALAILDDYLGEFPYKSPADKTNAFSVLLGAPLKTLGLGPGLFIDKPSSQTGATLLARSIAWIMEGRPPAVVTQGKTTGEMDKRIITKVKKYHGTIVIDNITGVFESELVTSGMTDENFGSRLLNLNEDAIIPTKSLTMMFTGNNFSATRDLLNRCIRCRLDANHPMPETRTGFRHILPNDIVAHRSMLVSAAASIVQRWIEAEMPMGKPVLGSFEAYTAAVSGLMEFAGFQDFDGNRLKMLSDATPAWETLDSFVCAWWEKHKVKTMSSADLLPLAAELDLKGYEDKDKAKSLSKKIGAARDKVYTIDEATTVKIQEFGRDENGRAKRGLKFFLEPLQ